MKDIVPQALYEVSEPKWASFLEASAHAGIALPSDAAFMHDVKKTFVLSDFVAKTLIRTPHLSVALFDQDDLNQSYVEKQTAGKLEKALASVENEDALGNILRQFRHREMVRIAFRDLTGRADLFETMRDLSDLADACVDQSFSILHKWLAEKFGTPAGKSGPQQIVVLGMGKLGAGELNFSSDIDLIFVYKESGKTHGGPAVIENEDFFVRLARSFLQLFGENHTSGLLFRVDLRLRPFGESGPLVMHFNAMEDYYQAHGREWERYALIKARVVAGDKIAGSGLLKRLNPFVYRRYFDYGTFDAIRSMKQSISSEVARKGLLNNIKIGPGGIREIEFFGQVFQLLRGGIDRVLQEISILKVLDILVKRKYIPQTVCDDLSEAYVFLRNTEHRLQEYADQQVHTLPADPMQRLRLAVSMGELTKEAFFDQLERHREKVHYHFTELLAGDGDSDDESRDEKEITGVWLADIEDGDAENILRSVGFEAPKEVLNLLGVLRTDPATRSLSSEGRTRLNKLIPLVIQKAGQSEDPMTAVKRIFDLIRAIQQRTCYLSLFLENPDALTHLVTLANISPWIISYLTSHPVLLDELLDVRTLYKPPSRETLANHLQNRFESFSEEDLEVCIEELTVFKQVSTLRVAAADISASYPLMRVSDHLSDIAELVLEKVLHLCFEYLVKKHGKPECDLESDVCDSGFAVIGYGKLGGIELGYGSDLDLVFLHAALPGRTAGGTGSPIENSQFYARLGQRIIHILTARTRAGSLYEIDMRLRPSGNSGPLVSHVESYAVYLEKEAWTWEHQALVRSRAITGDPGIVRRFNHIRKTILCHFREKDTLGREIKSMRDRMRKSHAENAPGMFDLKHGSGGIVDIEFLVQYLVLLNAHENSELVRFSDNVRQLEALLKAEIIDQATADLMRRAYLTFRAKVHRHNLQQKPVMVPETEYPELQKAVKNIWAHYLGKV